MTPATDPPLAWDPAPLCDRIRALIAQARPALPPGPTADGLDATTGRLAEPTLRVAVGGRLKAGKSTLINALAGQRIAPSAQTECTKLVAWYRASHQNRVEVRLRDGAGRVVPGRPGGGVPDDLAGLGVPITEVLDLRVEVVNPTLAQRYSIVDTPGTQSLSGLDEAALAALADADALVYVMPLPDENDREALEALRRNAPAAMSAANVIGVISRIDQLGAGPDPWPEARALAASYNRRLRGLVRTTVPVIGLLAQTAAGPEWTEADTRLVGRLAAAAAADPAEYAQNTETERDFRRWSPGPLDDADRDRLLGALGLYGLTEAVRVWREGARSPAGLRAALHDRSGIRPLLDVLDDCLIAPADRLRAAGALHRLERLRDAADGAALQVLDGLLDRLSEVRADPRLLQAGLSPALADLAAGRLALPEPDAQALVALATGGSPADCLGLPAGASAEQLTRRADEAVDRWRRLEYGSSRLVAQRAREALEVCQVMFFGAG